MKTLKLVSLCACLLTCNFLRAQVEVAHLQSKDISSTGLGAFLQFTVPVNEGDYVTLEGAAYFFNMQEEGTILLPVLVGYRRTIDGTGTGFYVEPTLGYHFGATDKLHYNKDGSPAYNESGSAVTRKVAGPAAGIGAGYTLRGQLPFTLGARYQLVRPSGDPLLHLFSLRLSYSVTLGRRSSDY